MQRQIFTAQDGLFNREIQQGTLIPADEDGVSSIQYEQVSLDQGLAPDSPALFYQPQPGLYYAWVEGQGKTKTVIKKYVTESFDFGPFGEADWLIPDSDEAWSDTVFKDGTPLLESEMLVSGEELADLVISTHPE